MSTALVAGASGLVGGELLRLLAADAHWSTVRALVRRPLAGASSNIEQVTIDYERMEPDPAWAAADHAFCALGTTIRKAGSQAAFRRVDFDHALAFARAAREAGTRHFLLVSALGAAANSRVFYSRVKGELEAALAALGFAALTIARPSILLGARVESRPAERLGMIIGRLLPQRWRAVPASAVARALIEAARRGAPGPRILENPALLAAPGPG